MAKAERILLSFLILLWVSFGHSGNMRVDITPNVALQPCDQLQYLTEYHKAFTASNNGEERVVPKLKIKTRYKGGEIPFVEFAAAFSIRTFLFAERSITAAASVHLRSVYSSYITLRGPPSSLS